MTLPWYAVLGVLFAGLVLAFLMVMLSSVSIMVGAVLVPALAVGAALVLYPFAGLMLLTVFAQLDAVANLTSEMLPVSLYKLLTLTTLTGFGLTGMAKSRALRAAPRLPEAGYVAIFGLIMFLSFLLCAHRAAAVGHMIGFASVMLLFFLIIAMVDTAAKLELLIWTMVLSGMFSSIIVLLDTLLGVRLISTSVAAATAEFEGQARSAGASDYNPTTAAHMLLATTILAGVLLVRHPRLRWLSFAALLVGVPALVFTFARSAVIAFGVVALIFAWQSRRQRYFALTLCLIALALAAALPFVPPLFWERMATLVNIGLDRTLVRRLSYNFIGLQLLSTHPVLGIGPGNFPAYYASAEFRWFPGREPLPRQLHNTYLEVAVETGILGIAAFLGVMLSSLRRAVQAAASGMAVAPMAQALAYAFGAFLVASIFMPNEDTKFMWIMPALCIAAWRLAFVEPAPAVQSGAEARR